MDEGESKNDEGRKNEPQEFTSERPLSSFCNGPMEESQEHLEEECPGCEFERRNLKMHTLRGRHLFWRRMKAKIDEKSKKKKRGWARQRGGPCGGTVG